MPRSRFNQSRRMPPPLGPGDVVECIDASGTGLSQGGIYRVDRATTCSMCGGGVTLTTGPQPPTDVPCGWWRGERFRPVRPKDDEVLRAIKSAKPGAPHAPTRRKKELEDA